MLRLTFRICQFSIRLSEKIARDFVLGLRRGVI